jgi:hypothetical protein
MDKRKTTETCELAKSGKRGVVKEKDLFNYMIIIPLQWGFVKLATPYPKARSHA